MNECEGFGCERRFGSAVVWVSKGQTDVAGSFARWTEAVCCVLAMKFGCCGHVHMSWHLLSGWPGEVRFTLQVERLGTSVEAIFERNSLALFGMKFSQTVMLCNKKGRCFESFHVLPSSDSFFLSSLLARYWSMFHREAST